MFNGFSQEELEIFSDFLERINKNLSGDDVDTEQVLDMLRHEEEKKKHEGEER